MFSNGLQSTRTYIQQQCLDTEYSLKDLPEVMDDGANGEREPEDPCKQPNLMMMMMINSVYDVGKNTFFKVDVRR